MFIYWFHPTSYYILGTLLWNCSFWYSKVSDVFFMRDSLKQVYLNAKSASIQRTEKAQDVYEGVLWHIGSSLGLCF